MQPVSLATFAQMAAVAPDCTHLVSLSGQAALTAKQQTVLFHSISSHAVVTIRDKMGFVIFEGDVQTPDFDPATGECCKFSEALAVEEALPLSSLSTLPVCSVVTLTVTSHPWEVVIETVLAPLALALAKYDKSLQLIVMATRPSDPSLVTAAAHVTHLRGFTNVTVVRLIPVVNNKFGALALVQGGQCHLADLVPLMEPGTLGSATAVALNAAETTHKLRLGLLTKLKDNAKLGSANACLTIDLGTFARLVALAVSTYPQLLSIFDGLATHETFTSFKDKMRRRHHGSSFDNGHGANYILDLHAPYSTNKAMFDLLKQHVDTTVTKLPLGTKDLLTFYHNEINIGNGAIAGHPMNSGEATDPQRPVSHLEGTGNPLPGLIVSLNQKLRSDSMTPENNVCIAFIWSLTQQGINDRMNMEAVMGGLLVTQTGVAAKLDRHQYHTVGNPPTQFISPGLPLGDPLRRAALLVAGDLGKMKLGDLLEQPDCRLGAAFLTDRLQQPPIAMSHDEALDTTAATAYSKYCAVNGAMGGVNDHRVLQAAEEVAAAAASGDVARRKRIRTPCYFGQ